MLWLIVKLRNIGRLLKHEEELIKHVLNSQKCYIVNGRIPLIICFNRNALKQILRELGTQINVWHSFIYRKPCLQTNNNLL